MEQYPINNPPNEIKINKIEMSGLCSKLSSEKSSGSLPPINEKIKKTKKSNKRCNHNGCNRKLSLVDKSMGACKCNSMFCDRHREPNSHNCTFDWHGVKKAELAEQLNSNKCVASKLISI